MKILAEHEVNLILSKKTVETIEEMESIMLTHEQVDVPVKERFINGMYAREILIPKGTLLTGMVYKEGYLDIMLSGDISVATPHGTKRMTGSNIMEAPPGRKRAGYAFQDTRWVTVHRTDKFDPDDMIDKLTFFSMGEYNKFITDRDHESYKNVLKSYEITDEEVQEQVQDFSDHSELQSPFDENVIIKESIIHGFGLMANKEFEINDVIGIARTSSGGRTIIGRYSNHSANPNAIMTIKDDSSVLMLATRKINIGDEITTHYGLTLQNIQGVGLCQA